MPRVTARTTRSAIAPSRTPVRTSPRGSIPAPSAPLTPPPPRPPREAGIAGVRPANGTIRACVAQRGELLHHRVVSAEGRDVAVTTAVQAEGFVTGAYPVQQGYLVMLRQPLYEVHSTTVEAAREQHDLLVRTLAHAGVRVVRARRARELREQAPHAAAETLSASSSAPSHP